jgi:hypothetical protein
MDRRVQSLFADFESGQREAAFGAIAALFEHTDRPVAWAYEVWDRLVSDLRHRDGHRRAFAAQMLARLAISDPDGRMLRDFPKVAAVMSDEKPVTARHTLQSLWRIGLAGEKQRSLVLKAIERRFRECGNEKGAAIIRTDALTALGKLFKATGDSTVDKTASALIESEPNEVTQRKQRAAWRKAIRE